MTERIALFILKSVMLLANIVVLIGVVLAIMACFFMYGLKALGNAAFKKISSFGRMR